MTKKNSRAIINTYSTIYDIDIIVANKHVTLKQLQRLYTYSNGETLDDEIITPQACTCAMYRKSDNMLCILVKHNRDTSIKKNKLLDLYNTAAHEAAHVALRIYEIIDERSFESQEPFAYLVGFITEHIIETWTRH